MMRSADAYTSSANSVVNEKVSGDDSLIASWNEDAGQWIDFAWQSIAVMFASSVLLCSALAKLVAFDALVTGTGIFGASPQSLKAAIAFELIVASGIGWTLTHRLNFAVRIAVGTYALLLCTSIVLAFEGIACGCFGPHTPAWLSVGVSVVALLGLVGAQCASQHACPRELTTWMLRWRFGIMDLCVFGLAILSYFAFVPHAFSSSDMAYCLPSEQVSRRWDLLTKTSATDSFLGKGNWTVMIVQPGCGKCEAMELSLLAEKMPRQLARVVVENDCWSIEEWDPALHWVPQMSVDPRAAGLIAGAPCAVMLADGRIEKVTPWRD